MLVDPPKNRDIAWRDDDETISRESYRGIYVPRWRVCEDTITCEVWREKTIRPYGHPTPPPFCPMELIWFRTITVDTQQEDIPHTRWSETYRILDEEGEDTGELYTIHFGWVLDTWTEEDILHHIEQRTNPFAAYVVKTERK